MFGMRVPRHVGWSTVLGAVMLLAATAAPVLASEDLEQAVDLTLERLHIEYPTADAMAREAEAVLVFPNVVKGGLIVGGQFGEGALRRNGTTLGYYHIASASFGLQAGADSFALVLMFMTDEVLDELEANEFGFEIGEDPPVALARAGTDGMQADRVRDSPIIAFVFGQQSPADEIGLEGLRISRMER